MSILTLHNSRPFLGCPALADLEHLFKTELICGETHRFRHYSVKDINLITTSLTRFLENIRSKHPRTLYICHVTRDDIILGFMSEYQRNRRESERPFEAALLVCGRKDKYQMAEEVRDMVSWCETLVVDVFTMKYERIKSSSLGLTPLSLKGCTERQ